MADTTVDSTVNVEQWADDEFYEYVRNNPLRSLMGTNENSVIQVKEELTKDPGDKVSFTLVSRLTGTGVTGDNTLEGNEEALGNSAHKVEVNQLRNGVVVGRFEKIKTRLDLLKAAQMMLRLWNMEQLRDLFIARMLSPVTDGATTYAAATETQKDAWEAANNPSTANQRILFGTAKANSSGDHSAGLANIDGTNDDMHQDIVRLGKRLVQTCDPHIRPVTIMGGRRAGQERFFHLMGSLPFRDLQGNFESVQQSADVRGMDNQIFTGDEIRIGNVICIEVPEMDRTVANGGTLISGVGAASIDVEASFLCGAQSLLLAWAMRMRLDMDEFDYKNKKGVACAEIRGCEKATYSNYQHGMGTVYVSAVGD